jgi:hypothetical protein
MRTVTRVHGVVNHRRPVVSRQGSIAEFTGSRTIGTRRIETPDSEALAATVAERLEVVVRGNAVDVQGGGARPSPYRPHAVRTL